MPATFAASVLVPSSAPATLVAMSQPTSQQPEHQRWTVGLIGFYLSCAGASLGAAIGFGGYFFFESEGTMIFGLTVSVISCITCFFSLRAARRGKV